MWPKHADMCPKSTEYVAETRGICVRTHKYVAKTRGICVRKAQNMWPNDLWPSFALPRQQWLSDIKLIQIRVFFQLLIPSCKANQALKFSHNSQTPVYNHHHIDSLCSCHFGLAYLGSSLLNLDLEFLFLFSSFFVIFFFNDH